MAYVITDTCIKDELCVEACPVDCIQPRKGEPVFESASQLYISRPSSRSLPRRTRSFSRSKRSSRCRDSGGGA